MQTFNEAGVNQTSFSVSKLAVSSAEFDAALLISDGKSHFLVSMDKDDLIFRKFELQE